MLNRRIFLSYVTCLLGFLSLATAVLTDSDKRFQIDITISQAVQSISLPGFETGMRLVSFPGNHALADLVWGCLILALLLWKRRKVAGYVFALSAGGGTLLNMIVKELVARPRPTSDLVQQLVHETSLSFPSGHVMHYVTCYGFLMMLFYHEPLPQWLKISLTTLCGTLILLVGTSRVYLGAHWPSDVTAGYLLGGLWLGLCIWLYHQWQAKSNQE
ncbi:MAG TPA: phosphatase PAP2 family protein [Acidobacteriota bacterium]|nr:phosphatase PAP2 family protein [Acidobacteriota bacterium]